MKLTERRPKGYKAVIKEKGGDFKESKVSNIVRLISHCFLALT